MDVLTAKQVKTIVKKMTTQIAALERRIEALEQKRPLLSQSLVDGVRKSGLVDDMSIFGEITEDTDTPNSGKQP
jgi:hypothetical protein